MPCRGRIARNMLASGDWVTARLDGVIYLEKSPLIYWLMAVSYKIFGAYDWAARIPIALSSIGAGLADGRFRQMGLRQDGRLLCRPVHGDLHRPFSLYPHPDPRRHADLHHRACDVGLFAGARMKRKHILAPGPILLAASLGVGLLLKSLIALVFPLGAAILYLLLTRQLFSANTWKRFHPLAGVAIMLLIAAPWHILATLANPPYFAFTLHSVRRPVSRLSVVLFHQRTAAAIFEFALSARLRHRAAPLLLAFSLDLAFSLERLLPRGR